MRVDAMKFRDGMTTAGLTLLILVCLPVVAALFLFARVVLIGLALVALVAASLAYAGSPGFRRWLSGPEQELHYSGLRFSPDVAMHRAHAWARIDDREATVGADDLVQNILGPVDGVELPPVGREVAQGDPLFTLRHGDRHIVVRAPISGRVVHTNPALVDFPSLVNAEPFGQGWAVRLAATDLRRERRSLFAGDAARAWFRAEVDRLLDALTPPGYASALPDGGVLVHELYKHIDDATWERTTNTFFGA